MSKKKAVENKRLYFIVKFDCVENVVNILNENKPSFIEKVYTSKINDSHFINMNLNITLDSAETFNKLAMKLNKQLNAKYKMFYKDAINKWVYIDSDILEDNKASLSLFIND